MIFARKIFGELETEAISGLYAKTLTHHFDAYGRNVGYSVNGSRRTFLGYDGDSGRIAAMNEGGDFHWEYLPGSDLKARLTYPNGLTAEWAYEPERDLLTAVTNSLPNGTTLSAYVYTNDLLGRRTSKNDEQYGYNVRDELTSANERTYAYDDIGNRTTAEGRSYTANNLNQYTAIDGFVPTFDADGNQTKVLTETGEWTVEYNAENRPIRWTQGNKVITMGFDRMGRRVFYKEMEGNRQITHTVFLYDGDLCIQQLFSNSPWNVYKEFIWDPTEPLATRPLSFRQYGQRSAFLLHDGNKNVTDVVTVGPFNEPVAHYDYAPFGAVTATGARALANPFRFSSEFHDDTLALVYYNYRHYNPKDGRWLGRDPVEGKTTYSFLGNNLNLFDALGEVGIPLVIKLPPISCTKDHLLLLRHGFSEYKYKKNPIAFTRFSLSVSATCYCDEAYFGWVGSINATLYITTYIYDESERKSVRITSNEKNKEGTRQDVLRHEQEHANDIEELFLNTFRSIKSFETFVYNGEECKKVMKEEETKLKDQFNAALENYMRDGGHSDPKYQKGGAAFVYGDFI